MSSPNLNIVTLLGSCLTYSSAYLFGIHNQGALVGSSMESLIQVGEIFTFILNIMQILIIFKIICSCRCWLSLSLVWALSEANPGTLSQ